MNTLKTVNTLMLADVQEYDACILQEIHTGSERGLHYMHRLFHLELWHFACGFVNEQLAFQLALKAIEEHWKDNVNYDALDTLLDVIYISLVLACSHFVETTPEGLCIKGKPIPEDDFYAFLARRKDIAKAYVAKAQQQLTFPSPN